MAFDLGNLKNAVENIAGGDASELLGKLKGVANAAELQKEIEKIANGDSKLKDQIVSVITSLTAKANITDADVKKFVTSKITNTAVAAKVMELYKKFKA